MTFQNRMTRAPIPFDLDRGIDARAALPDVTGPLGDLIAGAAGCSPYLFSLMCREAEWISPALNGAPEEALALALDDLKALAPDEMAAGLRRGKRRIALLAGLADLAGVWDLAQVTQALTDLADTAVDRAIRTTVSQEARRGKLPGFARDSEEITGGMVALAMGKMGAGELNYSSDIDLICLFDESQYEDDSYFDARTSLIRATRRMATLLSEVTGDGYVFRTDLRLRPDPSSTPVCMAMDPAERYYESMGRTWERAAHIKARPAAGDIDAGEAYLERLVPFVWRKHLDFAAIQDAHDIRLKIRAHNGFTGAITLPEHNMKLGRGGIREIEFFTQTRQLIAGGRDRELRGRGTVAMLGELAKKDWIPSETAKILATHYRAHREVEHRLQMISDAQTHTLPKTEKGFQRLANFMGQGDVSVLKREIRERLEEVHDLTESFFAPTQARAAPEVSAEMKNVMAGWPSYPALRSSRAVHIFERLKPEILSRVMASAYPEQTLRQFDGFLAGLPAGVQLFSLFEANPQLIDLILDISSIAPNLAKYLASNAQVFDAVIGGSFFDAWPGLEALQGDLSVMLAGYSDYESQLDAVRRWMKEWHFRIGVHHLRGLISANEAGQQYADLAQAVLAEVWPVVGVEFARKHGTVPGRGGVVLGMGSLGARRLHAASDLDLIVIYDAQDVEESDGRRPLAVRTYFARLTQAFVTALSAPMAEGRLYEVDMRLRPSGRAGPVATNWAAFKSYQLEEAWVWEHLALTRARPVAGNEALAAEFEAFRAEVLGQNGAADRVIPQVAEMRARISVAKTPQGDNDAKIGEGRLQDVELCAQAVALMAGFTGFSVAEQIQAGNLLPAQKQTLMEAGQLMWQLQAAARLLNEGPLNVEDIGVGGVHFLLRETGCESLDDMRNRLAEAANSAQMVIEDLFGQPKEPLDD
ncbi:MULTISPECIES: glutamine-synthetase adenylyltransferase [Falsihalocynthiibacter]|uniref:[protein-PII] uridylyltransferase family protein n=1 Tax=Falsihalocynthiibacter TaxID=2854182 RepID=UPI0030034FFD